ncbi:MAG TPA: hypothetical protein VIF62_19650, partial [Labilithrix sp.]
MEILFITGIALVAREGTATRDLLIGTFGLPLESMGGAYFASDKIEGAKHFGVWPLEEAAEACFGTKEWPRDRPIPQLSIELEVRDAAAVSAAEKELRAKGL